MYEHVKDSKEILDATRSLIDDVALSIKTRDFRTKNGKITSSFLVDVSNPKSVLLKKNLSYLYHDLGFGFKLLSSLLGNASYTRLRTIFSKLEIEKRTGNNCITDSLKKIRSERAKKNNPWKNWPANNNLKTMHKENKRYASGWYLNKSLSKYVWLRSSWEFAYAKFLDESGVVWDSEVTNYRLSDGTQYRPDFFIYDEKKNLLKIVEIKSTWSNGSLERIEKFEKFKSEYPEINSEIIIDDELFNLVKRTSKEIMVEWKKIKKMEKPSV